MEVPSADEIIKRIQSHKGVQGVIVTTHDGTIIRSTMDNTSTVLYINGLQHLYNIGASMIRDVDPTDGLLFFRIRTRKFEIMMNASSPENDYMAIVIQNPNEN